MSDLLSGFDAEVASTGVGPAVISGQWVEVAQVQQQAGKLSGLWVEVAQVQQETMKISAHWVEVVYLVGVAPDPEPVIAPDVVDRRRQLIMGLAAVPILIADPIVPPATPAALVLSVEAISTTQLQLLFANIDGAYYLYRLNGGEPTLLAFDKIVAGLTANTQYLVEVRAVTQGGPGDWSNVVLATTWQTIGTDVPPTPAPTPTPPPAQGTLVPAVAGGETFFGYVYSDTYGVAKVVVGEEFISYNGINGTPPYTYSWALLGNATLTPDTLTKPILSANDPGQYALPYDLDGGTTQFWALVPAGYTLEHSLRCTITDSLGATCYFDRHIRFVHYNIAPPPPPAPTTPYGGGGGGPRELNNYVQNV